MAEVKLNLRGRRNCPTVLPNGDGHLSGATETGKVPLRPKDTLTEPLRCEPNGCGSEQDTYNTVDLDPKTPAPRVSKLIDKLNRSGLEPYVDMWGL